MTERDSGFYAAFKARDARFDGRFFVGISSTGIYCRPVCRAKLPKAENCTFFRTAAQAEQAGYRPCLLCRPELAPGAAVTDASADLAYQAARMLEKECGSCRSLEDVAGKLGCTGRHLRRVFMAEYKVTPVQYMQTCRLLLAKSLLTDTNLTVLEVSMAAGFGSLRRFNDVFKKKYHLSPSALQKCGGKDERCSSNITLTLGYRPPYRWDEMLSFLGARAIKGVEVVRNGEYMRTVRMKKTEGGHTGEKYTEEKCTGGKYHEMKYETGFVRVGHEPDRNALKVTISETLMPVLPEVLARTRHLFDLYCAPDAVYDTLQVMNELRPGLCIPRTRVPGCFDVFEMAVRAVLGQQITVKAAGTLVSRIVERYGIPVRTGIEGLDYAFPSPEDVLALDGNISELFGVLGVTSVRSHTIYELARALAQGEINFDLCAQPEAEMKKLTEIRGIGSWTAQYIAMRAMGWPDAFPETDAGVRKALPDLTVKERVKMAEAWRPWRSYATVNLWNTL